VKLLIVTGPYEADRVRRAAVTAGLEAVVVEPGESLSAWITATRPNLIILAPQVVGPVPEAAIAKVRSVPRGRVPIILIGDAEDEARFRPLADDFFARPIAADELLARARAIVAPVDVPSVDGGGDADRANGGGAAGGVASGVAEGDRPDSGRVDGARVDSARVDGAGVDSARAEGARPEGARPDGARPEGARAEGARPDGARPDVRTDANGARPDPFEITRSSSSGAGRGPALRPLVHARDAAAAGSTSSAVAGGGAAEAVDATAAPSMFDQLAAHIDADVDADLRDVVRAVGVLRHAAEAARDAARDPEDDTAQDPVEDVREQTLVISSASDTTDHSPGAEGAGGGAVVAAGSAVVAAGSAPHPDEVELDLPSLLARMYLARLSGRLTLERGKTVKFIVFDRGHPVLAGSSLVGDRMGAMLVRQGRLTAAELSGCGAEVGATGRRLGEVLIDRGLVKPSELDALVRRHYEEVIYSLFAWSRGAWTLGADNSAAVEQILLSQNPSALILEGIRRKYDAERALACLGGEARVFRLRLSTGAADLLEKMGTTTDERNLVLLFDGVRRLGEIRALTRAPAGRLYGVAWALCVLERLEAVDAVAPGPQATAPDRGRHAAARSGHRSRARAGALRAGARG
jgi:hypothetical protein